MTQFKNFIGGEWVDDNDSAPNVNPSETSDVTGHFARPAQIRHRKQSRLHAQPLARGRSAPHNSALTFSTRPAAPSLCAKTNSVRCWQARKGTRSPKQSAKQDA